MVVEVHRVSVGDMRRRQPKEEGGGQRGGSAAEESARDEEEQYDRCRGIGGVAKKQIVSIATREPPASTATALRM